MKVCGGDSHCSAEDDGLVENTMRNDEWLERETVKWLPLIESGTDERENGRGEFELGSITEEMVRDLVSREIAPE